MEDSICASELALFLGNLKYANVTCVLSAEDALKIIETSRPSILLVDEKLKGPVNGIDFVLMVKEENIPILFVSTFEGDKINEKVKTVEPFALLAKPVNKKILESSILSAVKCLRRIEALSRAKAINRKESTDEIFIKTNNRLIKIKISDILAIEAEGNYCTFYTPEKKLVVKLSLQKILEKFDDFNFFQIHRKFVIQMSKIDSILISSNEVKIGQYSFPVGGKYKKEFSLRLNKV